jgi:sulfotransferase family protein
VREPNLFIVGAPRSGTTSLYRYLAQHPDVFMSPEKSPNFWSAELFPPGSIMSEERYLALFAGAGTRKWAGEASVSYLYSRAAAARIRERSPGAKIIAMLRDPADMIHSLHFRRVELGQEPFVGLEQALAAQEGRRSGALPGGYGLFHYEAVASYSEQLERYFRAFGRENVHVILYDDLRRDAAGVLRAALRFLDLAEDVPIDLSPVNQGRRIRSAAVYRLCWALWERRPTAPLGELLHRLNTQAAPPPPLSPELRARLTATLAPDIERVGALLGRDLGHWTRPRAGGGHRLAAV